MVALTDEDLLAQRVGEAMFSADVASQQTMGMELVFCKPGQARMTLQVTLAHLNGHQICHGGFIFTLADSTFAFACNSHNKVALAASASIDFLKPAQLHDVLTCDGQEIVLNGRHGVYDMTVRNQHNEVIALFRGKSAHIQGMVVPP
ncbi:MAG: hydroxyphenylacetyl-CoA thioesterase PaaI [Burkholderiales bacterium]|jgi:acyl-CoA thioesterase|nr:hydroxyphenylacetyl-CoA thioesterase PaaI [Burkholderiales bacterium]